MPKRGQSREVQTEALRKRRPGAEQSVVLKLGRSAHRCQPSHDGWKAGTSFTLSFTGTAVIDDIVDRWVSRRAQSRSQIIRAAILLADQIWSREDIRS